jgi:hypothetical protein
MAMRKTSGGNFPLWQGAGKSFWTLPIFGSMAAADHDVFWKSDRVFMFFPSGVFIGEGASSEVGQGGLTTRGASPGARRPVVWPPYGPSLSPLRFSGSFGKYLDVWLLFRPILRIFPV